MGRASNRKKEKRDRPAKLEVLRHHMQFLESSAGAFDTGFDAEALRLATSIRVLCHDTQSSKSLLKQLQVKDKMLYKDTAGEIKPGNMVPDFPLLRVELSATVQRYAAHRGEGSGKSLPPIPFLKWWNRPVMRRERDWSRWDLVSELANKEGGAHVDPNLSEDFKQLTQGEKLGFWHYRTDESGNRLGGGSPLDGDPVAESVRQITYELLETLYAHEGQIFSS